MRVEEAVVRLELNVTPSGLRVAEIAGEDALDVSAIFPANPFSPLI